MRLLPHIAVAGLVFLAGPASADGLPDTVRAIKPSIVGVGTYQQTRRPPSVLRGTGFVVGDGTYAVTNHHVVPRSIDRRHNERLSVFVGRGTQARVVDAEIVAEDDVHDIAVLKIGTRLPAMKLGHDREVSEGQRIAFTGFPIGGVLGLYPATHRGIVAARTPFAIPQRAQRRLDTAMVLRLRNPFEVFQLDATAYPGNSGSPLYLPETGEVIGVISSVFVKQSRENVLSDPSGVTYAIPIRHVVELLRKIGVFDAAPSAASAPR